MGYYYFDYSKLPSLNIKDLLKEGDIKKLKSCLNFVDEIADDLFYLYLEYSSRVVTMIITPTREKLRNGKNEFSKRGFRFLVDRTIKMGFQLKARLERIKHKKKKVDPSKEKDEEPIASDLLESFIKEDCIKINTDEGAEGSYYDCCEQLLRRLINVPITYYQNVLGYEPMHIREIDDYVQKQKKEVFPDVMVGKSKEIEANDHGQAWAKTYEMYMLTFMETLRLISKSFYSIR